MPIATVVQRVQYGLAGLDANLDVLVNRHDEIEPELAQDVHDRLIELAAEISEAFGI